MTGFRVRGTELASVQHQFNVAAEVLHPQVVASVSTLADGEVEAAFQDFLLWVTVWSRTQASAIEHLAMNVVESARSYAGADAAVQTAAASSSGVFAEGAVKR